MSRVHSQVGRRRRVFALAHVPPRCFHNGERERRDSATSNGWPLPAPPLLPSWPEPSVPEPADVLWQLVPGNRPEKRARAAVALNSCVLQADDSKTTTQELAPDQAASTTGRIVYTHFMSNPPRDVPVSPAGNHPDVPPAFGVEVPAGTMRGLFENRDGHQWVAMANASVLQVSCGYDRADVAAGLPGRRLHPLRPAHRSRSWPGDSSSGPWSPICSRTSGEESGAGIQPRRRAR